MAFRIPYQGVVVEVDSASEVRDFLVMMAAPLPKLLGAGAAEPPPELRPQRAARRHARRAKRQPQVARGGGRRLASPERSPAAVISRPSGRGERQRERLRLALLALADGPRRTADVAVIIHETLFATRCALQAAEQEGLASAAGATQSRRWSLTAKGQRATGTTPKEAVR